jgi:hypothetical protein
MSHRWSKIEALLDKEVQRETRKYLAKIRAVVSGGHGNGVITARPVKAKKRVPRGTSLKRQLHGKYLGLTRTLPKAEKAKLSALYKEKGVRAAIRAAKAARASAAA